MLGFAGNAIIDIPMVLVAAGSILWAISDDGIKAEVSRQNRQASLITPKSGIDLFNTSIRDLRAMRRGEG